MIDFEPNEQTRLIIEGVRRFIQNEVKPEEEKLSEILYKNPDGLGPDGRKLPELLAARNRIFKRSADAGYLNAHMPERVGGSGISHVDVFFLRKDFQSERAPFTLPFFPPSCTEDRRAFSVFFCCRRNSCR